MPEFATQTLKGNHNDIYQPFDCTIAIPPADQLIDQTLPSPVLALTHSIGRMEIHSEHSMVSGKGRAPIELLPVEIFGVSFVLSFISSPNTGLSSR